MRRVQVKTTTVMLGSVGIACCLLVSLTISYLVGRSYWNYQTDVNNLNSVATQLGYASDRRLNFYEAESMEYKFLGLVFYTPDSLDQFSNRVQSLGFRLERFDPENRSQSGMNASFLGTINYGLRDKFVTLNGRYRPEDFSALVPPPLVSTWKLYSSTLQHTFEVEYGRSPNGTDVWVYEGRLLGGNVVVVMLHRPACWGC